jgi:DNA polymerase III subunit beta
MSASRATIEFEPRVGREDAVKFRVDRDVFGEAVSWVARALPTRPVVPVLSGMLVQASNGSLTLSCFDYEVSARVGVPAEVGEPGTALLPGRLLAEITRTLPASEIEVTLAAGMLMLTCGSAEFALVCLPVEDYPQLPELPAVAGSVDGGLLAAAAAQVVPAASRDDTLPMLTGVCLEFDGPSLTLAATDRYRLAVRTLSWEPADPSLHASALVPARTLADVARTMGPGKPVTITFSAQPADDGRSKDGMISFEGGGRQLTARLIGGEFVKYRSRFPASFEATAEVTAAPFIDAVRRVCVVADRATPVQLAFRRDVVVIEAQSDGRARGVESVPVRFTGPNQVISFNPHYLLDGLAAAAISGQAPTSPAAGEEPQVSAGGWIKLEFTSPAKPAVISWIAGDATVGAAANDPVAPDHATSVGNAVAPAPAAPPGPGDSSDQERQPGRTSPFRYLVVPLRVPVHG